jgi:hypothetical protein
MIGGPTSPGREPAAGASRALVPSAAAGELSGAARRALAHIRARTITGRFAYPLYDMPPHVWDAALDELRAGGYQIVWTHGHVADESTVTGGYILAAQLGDRAR